jgi:uncharacterized membrane protein
VNPQPWSDAVCWVFKHTAGNQAFQVAYRWLHYLSATAFVGLLLFLTLLTGKGPLSPEYGVGRVLLQRVFWLWRWAIMAVLFTGLNLLHMLYNFPTGNYFDEDKGMWMAIGASLGFFIWGLVWFWIWPAQKRHFAAWEAAGSAEHVLAPRSSSGIRLATLLLPPLVMGMAVGGHGLTLFSWGWRDVAWTFAVGCLPVLLIYRLADRAWAREGKAS